MFKRLRTAAFKIGAALLLAALLLAAYHRLATQFDARRFPQRGKSFQVGSIKLNLNCTGQGSPTVVLDSGLGGAGALDWVLVQPHVARFTRVCSYDRAGYAWSEPSSAPRTSIQIATELKALLDAAGEQAPFILVGHSFGGYNVRVFTGLYPKTVAGLVLVDASHPDEERRINQTLTPAQLAAQRQTEHWNDIRDAGLDPLRRHLGLQRIAITTGLDRSPYLTKALQLEFLYLQQSPKYRLTTNAENSLWETNGAQAVAAGALGDRPLIVLTAGRPYDPDPLLTPEQIQQQNNLWIHDLQVEEMHLSTRGEQIIVPNTGHDIPTERPDAIVSAIRRVWSLSR